MADPTWQEAQAYLGETSWSDAEITAAFNAERAAQARVCRIPSHVDSTDPLNPVTVLDWPDDLREALNRRVAHNLALRNLPLGVQASISQAAVATNRVGGTDAEVARLESPYRKLVCG